MLEGLVIAVRDWATAWGGPGLFLMAALDSSFLSFPQVNDVLIVYLSLDHPARWWYYSATSTAGSVLGGLALHGLGQRGGTSALARRLTAGRIEQGLALYRRFGMLALAVPALFPPPTPFKALMLLAGASGMSRARFLLAMLLGRGTRYFGTGWLAVVYGRDALAVLATHTRAAALGGLGLTALAVAGWFAYRAVAPTASAPEV